MRRIFYYSNLLTLCIIFCSLSVKAQVPVVTANPQAATVCAGNIAWFSVTANDTPSAMTVQYLWEVSVDTGSTWDTVHNGGSYVGALTDTLHVSAAGTMSGYMYRVIAYNDSGAAVATVGAPLTVNPLPVAGSISGSSSICMGTTTPLTSSVSGGTWMSSNTTVDTINNIGMVYGVAAGTDTITYTVTNSCGAATAHFMMSVNIPVSPAMITGPSVVCVGSIINQSNVNTGGTWMVSNGRASISTSGVVSGIMGGLDTVFYSFTNACGTVTSHRTITIDTALSIGTLTGSSSYLCDGSWMALTTTVPGGVFLSSDGSVATVDMSGFVTGRAQGTAIISYMLSNACGEAVVTDTLHIQRTASMITGPDSVGLSLTITLGDSVAGGTWSTTDTAIAHVNSSTGVVTGHSSGVAIITYMVTNVCGTSWSSMAVNVGPAPAAGVIYGPDSVCQGSFINMGDTVVPGGMWGISNASASINDSGKVTGIAGGVFDTVKYTVSNAFGSTTVTKRVYVNRPPVISITGPSSYSLGISYNITGNPAGGSWVSLNTTDVRFIGDSTFVPLRGGTTPLVYYATNTCGTSTDTFFIILPVVAGVKDVNGSSVTFNIIPNPNSGAFVMNLVSGYDEIAHVVVTNMIGETVKEIEVPTNKMVTTTLDQPAGIYMLNAVTAHDRFSAKITIAK